MDTSFKRDDEVSGQGASRQMRSLQEKMALVQEALEPGNSVAAVARKHGVNSNLLFGWIRLHQRGLLAKQRQPRSVPLLPVKVTTPTLTLTEPASAHSAQQRTRAKRAAGGAASHEVILEVILPRFRGNPKKVDIRSRRMEVSEKQTRKQYSDEYKSEAVRLVRVQASPCRAAGTST